MLDHPLEYTTKFLVPRKKAGGHLPDKVETIVTFHGNDKIIIPIEHFGNILFIKFFPHKLRNSTKKYKKRVKFSKTPVRIFSTCVSIVAKRFEEYPETIIGVHGSWDSFDVKKQKETSDRYNLWLTFANSKFNKEKFIFVANPKYNTFFVMRADSYSKEKIENMKDLLSNRFINIHEEFMIPNQ